MMLPLSQLLQQSGLNINANDCILLHLFSLWDLDDSGACISTQQLPEHKPVQNFSWVSVSLYYCV